MTSLLNDLGLNWRRLEATKGVEVANHFHAIIDYLRSVKVSTQIKIQITSALLTWQSVAEKSLQDEIFKYHSREVIAVILEILLLPDDGASRPNGYAFGNQMPALFLSKYMLHQRYEGNVDSIDNAAPSILNLLLQCRKVDLTLRNRSEGESDNAGSIRTDTLHNIIMCLPCAGMLR